MNTPRKASIALLAGLAVTGIVGAAAASFGGFDAESLGSESTVVAACDTDGIDVGFTTLFEGGNYVVDSVDFSDVADECDGLDFDVTLTDGDDVVLGSSSDVVDLDVDTFSASFSGVSAESVDSIALVISG
jgi:hypothetical protein